MSVQQFELEGPRRNDPATYNLNHSYTTASVYVRRAIDRYRDWIECRLGIGLSEAIILHTSIEFRNAAASRLLGYADANAPVPTPLARLAEQIDSAEAPESIVPIVALEKHRPVEEAGEPLTEESSAYSLEWTDGPVLLRLRSIPFPVVTLNVRYHAGPESSNECEQEILIIPKHGLAALVALLKEITRSNGKPKLKIGYEEQAVIPCDWDQLTLDPDVLSLLKDDFNMFFKPEFRN